MRARANVSIGLHADGDKVRAVEIRGGCGCNLWLGDVVITADNAALFRELAEAALEAARIQEQADKLREMPHVFRGNPSIIEALGEDRTSCSLCGRYKADPIHVGGGK